MAFNPGFNRWETEMIQALMDIRAELAAHTELLRELGKKKEATVMTVASVASSNAKDVVDAVAKSVIPPPMLPGHKRR